MLVPVSNKNVKGTNPLAERAKNIVDSTTPEPAFVDPSLYDPVQRNPDSIVSAINALAQSRNEANTAANVLARQNYNDQIQQLILSQLLGVGGAIGNAVTGGNVQTGIDQRVAQSLPTAMNLRNQLTQQEIQAAMSRAETTGQAGLDVAKIQEQYATENQKEEQAQRQLLQSALDKAYERARQTGIDVRQALMDELSVEARNRQLGVAEINAATNVADSETRRFAALANANNKTGTSGKVYPGDPGYTSKTLQDVLSDQARLEKSKTQMNAILAPGSSNPYAMEAGGGLQSTLYKNDQNLQDNLAKFRYGLRSDETKAVGGYLAYGIEGRNPVVTQAAVDELQLRLARNPNDPELKSLEQSANAGKGAEEAVSLNDYLTNLEAQIASGQF